MANTTIVSSLFHVRKYLETGFVGNDSSVFCCNKIAIKEYKNNDTYIVRIWNTFSFLDLWYYDYSCVKNDDLIAILDYEFKEDYIKITHITINDFELALYFKHNNYLNTTKANEIRRSLIMYIINKAAQNNKKKIIMDVHRNLFAYKSMYMNLGFKLTNRISEENMHYVEMEWIL